MNISLRGVALVLIAVMLSVGLWVLHGRDGQERRLMEGTSLSVYLAVNPSRVKTDEGAGIHAAWKSVLEEEGVPFQTIDVFEMLDLDPERIAAHKLAILLPDGIAAELYSRGGDAWLRRYCQAGGTVAAASDAGTMYHGNLSLPRSELTSLLGFSATGWRESKKSPSPYVVAKLRFASDASIRLFEIPPGKTIDRYLSGYKYGHLTFTATRTVDVFHPDQITTHATLLAEDGSIQKAIVEAKIGRGTMLWTNLHVGHLKCQSDDLLLRSFVRAALFQFARVPHVLNVEDAMGALVINWHIDSNAEHLYMPRFIAQGLLHPKLPMSFHVTAGTFRDTPGDGLGFVAWQGRGRQLLERLIPYGAIGSHGGWAHNWFAREIEAGRLSEEEIERYIRINSEALESVTGKPVVEYSAPVGVHPQPTVTKILERLGFVAYYYTGDSGSVPNRSFFNGKMVSDKVIAFPVVPFGRSASLYEMSREKRKPQEVYQWLLDTVRLSETSRTARLVYSHPYDIEHYEDAVLGFLSTLKEHVTDGRIHVRTMENVARFWLKAIKTVATFEQAGGKLRIRLANPQGLKGIAFAVPKRLVCEPAQPDWQEDDNYFYGVVHDDRHEAVYEMPLCCDGHFRTCGMRRGHAPSRPAGS